MKLKPYHIFIGAIFFILLFLGALYSGIVYLEGVLYIPKEYIEQYKQEQKNIQRIQRKIYEEKELYKRLLDKNQYIKKNAVNLNEVKKYINVLLRELNGLKIGRFDLIQIKQDNDYINMADVLIHIDTNKKYLEKHKKILADIVAGIFKKVFYVANMSYDDKKDTLTIKLYKPSSKGQIWDF